MRTGVTKSAGGMQNIGAPFREALQRADAAKAEGYCAEAIEEYMAALHHCTGEMARSAGDVVLTRLLTEAAERIMDEVTALKAALEKEVPEERRVRAPRERVGEVTPPQQRQAEQQGEGEQRGFEAEIGALMLGADALPDVRWEDVVGLGGVKRTLQLAIQLPRELPHLMLGGRGAAAGLKSLLLYGPPGVGKTFIVKALARESGMAFFPVSAATLTSKWVGDSMKHIKAMFDVVKARKPAILFLDEIDALCADRDSGGGAGQSEESKKAVSEFLQQCDGITPQSMEGVMLIGATNRPWRLDDAVLRRLTQRVYIPLPDEEGRDALLAHYLARYTAQDVGPEMGAEAVARLAQETRHYSASEIDDLVGTARRARLEAIVTDTTHFKAVRFGARDAPQSCIVPCEATDPHAHELAYAGIADKSVIRLPRLSEAAVRETMRVIRPAVNRKRLREYAHWTREHGAVDAAFIQKMDAIEGGVEGEEEEEESGGG